MLNNGLTTVTRLQSKPIEMMHNITINHGWRSCTTSWTRACLSQLRPNCPVCQSSVAVGGAHLRSVPVTAAPIDVMVMTTISESSAERRQVRAEWPDHPTSYGQLHTHYISRINELDIRVVDICNYRYVEPKASFVIHDMGQTSPDSFRLYVVRGLFDDSVQGGLLLVLE